MDLTNAKHNEMGPRIIGREEWERRQAAKNADASGGVRLGSRIVEPEPAAPVADQGGAQGSENPFGGESLPSVAETEKLLSERPELFDDAYAAEVMATPPRKSALQLLLRIERDRPEPRENVVRMLQGMIGA